MRRLSPLTTFVVFAFGWIVVLTAVWSQVSPWTSYPVGVLSHIALEQGAPMWVRTVRLEPGNMEVDFAVSVTDANGRRGEITVDASPARYAYGLPIFLALLLAARGKKRIGRAVAGYLLLLPAQAFSLTFYVLMQLVLAVQLNIRALRLEQWQMELIVYAYQLGALVVPTLAPIVLWLWLDKKFVTDVVMRGWKGDGTAPSSTHP
ncbi:exosortase H-associated membrane protein [Acidovorax radicis]|jgi:hypothetical protein|uniref:exosortase H-associated membrane protein n=1 Tax=Acidovorax radicis TaxID=758826 RepID=UPI001CFA73E5|nr:exosortase H-associated membrane protein [Acidovorax radicis]UCU99742.1 hypothetical protein KI609_02815 [Acidovorax radicis]